MLFSCMMSIGLAVATFSGANSVSAKEAFTDLGSVSWAEEAIYYLNERGIINGYGPGYFGAKDNITRGQAAVMLVRELYPNEESTTVLTFPDVDKNSYYYNAIAVAVDRGIFNGNPDGTFKPDDPISRAATAKILAVAYGLNGTKGNFSDLNQAQWATEFVNALASNNISTGYSDYTFKPNNPITRAEFSLLFARVLNENFRAEPDFGNPDYYYEYVINEIAAEARKEKTDAEKVLYVYHALGKHIEYEDRGLDYLVSHTGKGAIVNGKAYCDGYSEAIIAVLERLNIEAVEVVSWPMNHSWVMVNIDGEYYHMDLTWDDSSNNPVSYRHFLLSDHEMLKVDHHSWETDLVATSDKYLYIKETMFFDDRDHKPLEFKNGYFYYLDTSGYINDADYGAIKKVSFDNSSTEVVPGLKFQNVYVGKEWYYGLYRDDANETYEIYKFKVSGEKHLLDAGTGTFYRYGVDSQNNVFQYMLRGEDEYRTVPFQ